jgi:hypothetical protein
VLHAFHAVCLFRFAHNQRLKFFCCYLHCNTVAWLPSLYMPFFQDTCAFDIQYSLWLHTVKPCCFVHIRNISWCILFDNWHHFQAIYQEPWYLQPNFLL